MEIIPLASAIEEILGGTTESWFYIWVRGFQKGFPMFCLLILSSFQPHLNQNRAELNEMQECELGDLA